MANIKLARPLPGNYDTLKPRKMGDEAEVVREQTDVTGHHLTFVVFPDGERRVLVDKDIELPSQIEAKPQACAASIDSYFDIGGES